LHSRGQLPQESFLRKQTPSEGLRPFSPLVAFQKLTLERRETILLYADGTGWILTRFLPQPAVRQRNAGRRRGRIYSTL
jgi:hypothetical protein